MTPEEARQHAILESRARLLASARTTHSRQALRLALFAHKGVRYAIDVGFVTEVARIIAPTPLPLTPSYWLGVSSLHGTLLGVADIGALLADGFAGEHIAGSDEDDATRCLVLVVGRDRPELGLRIDQVLETRSLDKDLIPIGANERGAGRGLIGAATKDGVQLIVAAALLSDPRLFLQRNDAPLPPT